MGVVALLSLDRVPICGVVLHPPSSPKLGAPWAAPPARAAPLSGHSACVLLWRLRFATGGEWRGREVKGGRAGPARDTVRARGDTV